jgi:putative transposase
MPDWRQWETASDAEWGLAVKRESIIRPLAAEGKLSAGLLHDAMLQLNVGRSVLYKLIQRYRRRPKTSSLLPLKRGRGSNVRIWIAMKRSCCRPAFTSFI